MPRKEFELSCMYGDVNRFLCAATTEPMTTREIAERANITTESRRISAYANHLVKHGLLEKLPVRPEKVGKGPGAKYLWEYKLTNAGIQKQQERVIRSPILLEGRKKRLLQKLRALGDPSTPLQIKPKVRWKMPSLKTTLEDLVGEGLVTQVLERSEHFYYINRKGLEYLKAQ